MDNLIIRLQLRTTIQDYITQLMAQNNISAAQMEDALNYVMLLIKDAAMNDYAIYADQDKTNTMQNLVQSYESKDIKSQTTNDQFTDNNYEQEHIHSLLKTEVPEEE